MTEKFHSIVKVCTRFIALSLAFVSLATVSYAQSRQVSGTVRDTDGNPLLGVTVIAVGTSVGMTTSIDGQYTLNVPAEASQLRYSYIGYEDVTIDVGSQTTIDVTMRESSLQIDEIVVNVGYGVQKRRDLTGVVSSVDSKVLESMPVTSVAEALTGRMAGVQVTSTEGGPDAEIKIRVRGGGSITQDNSPLYIVDGFPVESINDIPASDIQSIDVLKDASSTAIYGARGANGVIIVTTKSAKAGKVKVGVNAYVGFKNITKTLDVLDPYEYVQWQYELANYRTNAIDDDTKFTKYYGAYDDLELYKSQKGINWQDEIFGRTALTQNYNVSVSGGSEAVRFNLSLSHIDDESIMMGSDLQRNNITFKMNANISPKLSMDFSGRYSKRITHGAGTSTEGASSIARLTQAVKYMPTLGISQFLSGDDDYLEELEESTDFNNPIDITRDEYRRNTVSSQDYNIALNYKILNDLTFRTEFGATQGDQVDLRFYGVTTSRARNNNGNPIVYRNNRKRTSWRNANTLTYTPQVGSDHSLTILLGQELTSSWYKDVDLEVRNLSRSMTYAQAFALLELGDSQPISVLFNERDNTSSFFGRANYSYKDRYLLTASLRADGSSKFAKGHRWGYFPSVAGAWRLSEEPFMSDTKNWLYTLKIRASYGVAGNDRIPSGVTKHLYQSNTSSKPIAINNQAQTVLRPSNDLPNVGVKWETTYSRNLGVDFGLFGARLNGTIDVYWNTVKDLLIRKSIPSSTGYEYQYQNVGQTSNKGIEISLDGTIIDKRDFRMGASFNIGFNKNKVDKLGSGDTFYLQNSRWYNSTNPDSDYILQVGKAVGIMYGYVTDGFYSIDDFDYVYNETTKRATWTLKEGIASSSGVAGTIDYPGMIKFKDLNDDGSITTEDKTIIGNAQPKAVGGFSLNFAWKKLTLEAFFNYSIGNDIYNANKIEFTTTPLTRKYGNILSVMEDRFTYIDRETGLSMLNDIDRLREVNANASMWSPIITRVPVHSWAIEDGSFLRLSNVTIGYTLPEKWTRKAFIESLRVYVTGYNLALITNYTGYDPEVDAIRATPLTPGVDYSAFPRARTFVAGVNITF